MRYVDPLGLAQRIVIVVGLGLGLMVLGAYLVSGQSGEFRVVRVRAAWPRRLRAGGVGPGSLATDVDLVGVNPRVEHRCGDASEATVGR